MKKWLEAEKAYKSAEDFIAFSPEDSKFHEQSVACRNLGYTYGAEPTSKSEEKV